MSVPLRVRRSVPRGDVIAQLRETRVNIGAVLDEAARLGHGGATLSDLTDKAYVRDPNDAHVLAAFDEVPA
jgi:hypothetical protein